MLNALFHFLHTHVMHLLRFLNDPNLQWKVSKITQAELKSSLHLSNRLKFYNVTDFDIPVCLLIQERVNYLQQIIDEQT